MPKVDQVAKFGYFKMVLGMTRLLVEQMPDEKVAFRPADDVRTFAEVVSHMYTFLVEAAETVRTGVHESLDDPNLKTRDEMLQYMDEQVGRFLRDLRRADR